MLFVHVKFTKPVIDGLVAAYIEGMLQKAGKEGIEHGI